MRLFMWLFSYLTFTLKIWGSADTQRVTTTDEKTEQNFIYSTWLTEKSSIILSHFHNINMTEYSKCVVLGWGQTKHAMTRYVCKDKLSVRRPCWRRRSRLVGWNHEDPGNQAHIDEPLSSCSVHFSFIFMSGWEGHTQQEDVLHMEIK